MDTLIEFLSNHFYLAGAFVVLLVLFIRNETSRGGQGVSPQELVNLVNHKDAVILDVRENKEFAEGHIVKSVNIPHGSLDKRLSELNKYKEKPLVVACKMGQHSGAVGTVLRKAGFAEVSRLSGGITEWRNQNLPLVKK
ncbi:MAG: rhodanese-like domain-containing protein [Pseudomonadales bacterium]|nr:rhodanese-like domain-containing protein [Pseudomonadales bacterium]